MRWLRIRSGRKRVERGIMPRVRRSRRIADIRAAQGLDRQEAERQLADWESRHEGRQ